jgi:hypothetical protein
VALRGDPLALGAPQHSVALCGAPQALCGAPRCSVMFNSILTFGWTPWYSVALCGTLRISWCSVGVWGNLLQPGPLCSALRCSVVLGGALWCLGVLCGALWFSNTLWYSAACWVLWEFWQFCGTLGNAA